MARTRNYVNNVDLLEELYLSIEQESLTRKGLDMLMKLAQRTQRKLYYSCDDDKQHCLSEAYFDLIKRWTKFNPYSVRSFGFELIDYKGSGGKIELSSESRDMKFYKDPSNRESILKCETVSGVEIGIRKDKKISYLKITDLNIDWTVAREGFIKANPHLFKKPGYRLPPEMPTVSELLLKTFSNNQTGIFDPLKTRVRVKYKILGLPKDDIKYSECWVYKTNAVVKDPNPFSYFTSICINGYAKGFKELRPKKDKGKFISLDAGFNNDDGTDLFNT